MKKRKIPQIKIVYPQGIKTIKAQCPECLRWAELDDDQYHGRVSIQCATLLCRYHETINFSRCMK